MRNRFPFARRASNPAEFLPGFRAGRTLFVCTAVGSLLLLFSGMMPADAQDAPAAGTVKPAAAKSETATENKPNSASAAKPESKPNPATAAKPAENKPAEVKTDATARPDNPTDPPSYPDKESGDQARTRGEYGAAVSFYRQYRAKAEQNGDSEARQNAYACELDALILANLAESAAKLLDEYRAAFPRLDPNLITLWQAEIALIRRSADEADRLLQQLLPSLRKDDPEIFTMQLRVFSCAAFAAELKGEQATAAKYYGDIAGKAGLKTSLGRRALERQALSLVALGKYDEAFDLLKKMSDADSDKRDSEADKRDSDTDKRDSEANKRNVDAISILRFFLILSRDGIDAVAEEWSKIQSISAPRKDNFFFLAACRIGDEFSRREDYRRAAEAFNLAYSFAVVREDAFDAMTRLIGAFQRLDDRKTAADLVMNMLAVFKDSKLSPDFKLQIASILFRADRPDDAMDICLSCISDTAEPAADRESVYRKLLDMMLAEKAYPSARKFVAAFDTVPAKKTARAMDLADITWREGKPAEAAKLYRAIGESSAEYRSEAMLNAMRCSLEAALYADLLETAAALRKADPEHIDPEAVYLSAIAQEKTGDAASAAQSYLDYEKTAPKTAATLERRGAALYAAGRLQIRLGEPGKAVESLRRLRQDYASLPAAGPGRYWLIHALYASGDEVGAERESWRFIEDDPESEYAGAALLRLAEHYRGIGSVQHAESTVDQLLNQEKYPKIRARASYEKALIAFHRDDLPAALAALEAVDALSPDAALKGDVHYLRGDIARASNDFTTARAEYEAAAKTVPGTLLEQAALGSAADCIYALATDPAASPAKPKEPPSEASQAQQKPDPASQTGTKPSAAAQAAGTAKSGDAAAKPADTAKTNDAANPAEPEVVFPSAEACRLAAEKYKALLKIDDLRPEYRAMAIYKAGQAYWKAGDEKEAFELFNQMQFLVPAKDAASRPVEAFWIFRAVDALESLAHKDPSIPNVRSAVSALQWLEQTGTADPASVRQRVRALRKKQYQPALPASSNTTTTPESSKS